MEIDRYGRMLDWHQDAIERDTIAEMFSPVRCTHCRRVYDVGTVEVTARYSDCSVWKSPCCKRTVDDRGAGWKSRPDIEHLERHPR